MNMASLDLRSIFLQIHRIIDRFLPFTSSATPLIQDILHTSVLCSILYFAPCLVGRLRRWREENALGLSADSEEVEGPDYPGTIQTGEDRDENQNTHLRIVIDSSGESQPALDDIAEENNTTNLGHFNLNELEETADQLHYRDDVEVAAQQGIRIDGLGRNALAADTEADSEHPVQNRPANNQASQVRSREVGKKKAASLARRDQRRAYYEFLRSQGDAQRARDRAAEASLSPEQLQEKERRARVEWQLREKRQAEWTEKRERESQIRERNIRHNQSIVARVRDDIQRKGWSDIEALSEDLCDASGHNLGFSILDAGLESSAVSHKKEKGNQKAQAESVTTEWIIKLVRADGLPINEIKDGSINILTTTGFLVRVNESDMRALYHKALEAGEIDPRKDSRGLSGILKDTSVDGVAGVIGWEALGHSLQETLQDNPSINPEENYQQASVT